MRWSFWIVPIVGFAFLVLLAVVPLVDDRWQRDAQRRELDRAVQPITTFLVGFENTRLRRLQHLDPAVLDSESCSVIKAIFGWDEFSLSRTAPDTESPPWQLVAGPNGLSLSGWMPFLGRSEGGFSFRGSSKELSSHLLQFPNLAVVDRQGQTFGFSPSPGSTGPWLSESFPRSFTRDGKDFSIESIPIAPVDGVRLVSIVPISPPWRLWAVSVAIIFLGAGVGFPIVSLVRRSYRRKAVNRKRALQQQMFSHLPEGIIVLGTQNEVVWANSAFLTLIQAQQTPARLSGVDLWDLPVPGAWIEVESGQREWAMFEAYLRGVRGGWTPVTAGLTRVDGQLLLSVLDRTEAHQAEQLLRHGQKLSVLGQLAGGVAHDLNNLLGILVGMTDLLRVSLPEQDPLQESIEVMQSTLTRASVLSDRMLNFARSTPPRKEPLDANVLLRELRFLSRTAVASTLAVNIHPCDEALPIVGDENLLLSALLNLVLNAADASTPGGIVEVRSDRVGDRCVILVSDTGSGMDQATLDRIFEPFFTTKGQGKGTGLGLGLVRRTILDHHGSISVRSKPQAGTQVELSFPLVLP